MTKDAAWKVIQAAFRGAAELQELLVVLKQSCDGDEYKGYAMGVATAIDTINVELTDRVLSAHPELAARIESDLAKFGRLT